ncbi:MAG: transposase [Anaerolineaceae bacterium]
MDTQKKSSDDQALPQRKTNRLSGFDYSTANVYFVTICVQNRQNLFWSVGATCGRPDETPPLSASGRVVDAEIHKIAGFFKQIKVEKYCNMPDHIHMIVTIGDCRGDSGGRPQVAPTLSRIIQQFKGSITKRIGESIWQKSFYDHIIRDDEDYGNIWQYIDMNPSRGKG